MHDRYSVLLTGLVLVALACSTESSGPAAETADSGAPAGNGTAPADATTSAVTGSAGTNADTATSRGGAVSGTGGTGLAAETGGTGAAAGTTGDSGATAGTGAAGASSTAESYLGLAPLDPSQGFQIRSLGADIPPGQDLEYCEVAQLPGSSADVYWVDEIELGNAKGSHHLIVSVAVPDGAAEQKAKQLKVGDRVPCANARLPFGESGIVDVAGIQQPYDRFTMPEGVGWKYFGAQYLIFDYHFLNTTNETIQARSAINFHTTSESAIKHEATGFSISNYTIDTPARSSKSFTAECHVKKDVMVNGVARHTHKFGTDYDVWFSGGPRDGEHIWTSTDWELHTQYKFPEPFVMKAGEGFRYRCGFENPGDRPLRFGTSATDEMCILFVGVWEAHDGEGTGDTECAIVWNDAQGMGHPADEAGGIPKAPALTAATCGVFSGTDTECKRCTCEACGAPSVACALDPDCAAILTCLSECTADGTSGVECVATTCQATLDEHSSAIGLSRQAGDCISSMCKTCPNN